jgi:protein-disulfide isomerase
MKRYLPFVLIAVVLVAALGVTAMLVNSSRQQNANSPDPTWSGPPGADPPHVRGNPRAKVTVEEFGDFQCPSCGVVYPELKKIEEEFGQKILVVFREHPLQPPHAHALLAAQAAEAAGLQNHFWEMHDKLYETQAAWSDAKDVKAVFVDYARQLGLDLNRFTQDLDGDEVSKRITQDGIRGHGLGVNGTPTIFINGTQIDFKFYNQAGLSDLINKALSGAPLS